MPIKFDPTKITNKFGLAAVITLAFETLFFLWFQSASDSIERIAAGVLATLILVIFLFRIFSKDTLSLDSKLVFDPDDPNELNGDWIVASKMPRHGSVTYKRV